MGTWRKHEGSEVREEAGQDAGPLLRVPSNLQAVPGETQAGP